MKRFVKWARFSLLFRMSALTMFLLALLITDHLAYQVTLPLEIDIAGGYGLLHVGSQTLSLGAIKSPESLEFPPHDPLLHEYQLDGSDSTNNNTLNLAYLHSIASSPYYQFIAWMRDLDGTSRWRDLQVWSGRHLVTQVGWVSNGTAFTLPSTGTLRILVQLQRPETPMSLQLATAQGDAVTITLNRNDRQILITRLEAGVTLQQSQSSLFFPVDPLPFAAMMIDFLIRTLIWATLLLMGVLVGEAGLALGGWLWQRSLSRGATSGSASAAQPKMGMLQILLTYLSRLRLPQPATRHPGEAPPKYLKRAKRAVSRACALFTSRLHPITLAALGVSLVYVSWIALVVFADTPHIQDASNYFFVAKIYAGGQLTDPAPPAIDRFPGPFMLEVNGRWFGQYPPITSLMLALGIKLGVPWLVEPVLGTLTLLGIGLIAARLYDRQVATLAVLLGVTSPFYSYLAASYMSHTIALFYQVWGMYALMRFAQGGATWNLALAAASFGMAWLTRDLTPLLFIAVVLPGIMVLARREYACRWSRWLKGGKVALPVFLLFVMIGLIYNHTLTGSAWVTPRMLFDPRDHWGFGQGVGFYGQHTLAAGFVNLDELLTILAIDLFGWPFYLTLAFLVLPFLTWRTRQADWLLLAGAVIITGAFVGYYYHGIYLGPRYLFDTFPFLLMLTARGILTLAKSGRQAAEYVGQWLQSRAKHQTFWSLKLANRVTIALMAGLLLCNVLYFTPTQIFEHQNNLGSVAALDHPPVHHAIVVTDDLALYQVLLFPLNDPGLQGDVIYAWAGTAAEYQELEAAFPGRTLYNLVIDPDGSVHFILVEGPSPSTRPPMTL